MVREKVLKMRRKESQCGRPDMCPPELITHPRGRYVPDPVGEEGRREERMKDCTPDR